MNRKTVFIIVILLVIIIMPALCFGTSQSQPSNNLSKTIIFLAELKKITENATNGNEIDFIKDRQGIKYLSKDFDIPNQDTHLVYSVTIIKYDPSNYVLRMGMDGLERWLWERDLKKERKLFYKLVPGQYNAPFSYEGLNPPGYRVKYFGPQKFKYFDVSGEYIYDRIYSTFVKNYLVEFCFGVGTDSDKRSEYLTINKDRNYVFIGKSLPYINDFENMISEIKWR